MKTPILSVIIILFSCACLNAQELAVSGKVVDSKGSVLPSTLIILKSDASYHTTSDKNGKFVLNLPSTEKDTLIFLYGGYENREIAVDNQQTLDVVLNESNTKDSEVVALAYSAVKKKKNAPNYIPNAYQSDNSIDIPNGYDPKKDISIEIPNGDFKDKKTIIRKLAPKHPSNP